MRFCITLAAGAAIVLAAATPVGAWEFVQAMNAYGDRATGIVQAARNRSDARLAVGCDGDRWRIVAVGPPPGGGIVLDPDGNARTSFGGELGAAARWQVRKQPGGGVAYLAPSASPLVREMVGAERASEDAVFRVGVQSRGEPVVLEFPLAGLRSAIRADLWEPCKLGNYVPESELAD